MQAEIITIGDEILIGQTIDTNSAWIGQQLSAIGIPIYRTTSIQDNRQDIIEAIDQALERSQLVLVTGGLGPTKDDITKHTLCDYFDTELEINEEALERIQSFFQKRNRPMLDVNIQQAAMPKSCTVLVNEVGTASGMWFEKNGNVLVSMPGVPYEMKGLMQNEVLPRFVKQNDIQELYHETLMTQGIGESYLADEIQDWENEITTHGLSLAYLPSPGSVRLRLTSKKGKVDSELIHKYLLQIEKRFPKNVFGWKDITLEETVGELLMNKLATVGTVESCTGGAIASKLVSVSGSSSYFEGSIVSYSNNLKANLVGVNKDKIEKFGAVSEEVVIEMAELGRKKLNVDYCVSVSGVAGPTGGTIEKPVGCVWIAVSTPNVTKARKFQFGDNRERNIQMTSLSALNFLRILLLDID